MAEKGSPEGTAHTGVPEKRFYGAYRGVVADVVDPLGQGRVRVEFELSPQSGTEAWARVATLMAGDNRGTWFLPDVGDEVLVVFEAGDPRRPYVIGALWNAQSPPPESMDEAGRNRLKSIRSRSGLRISLDEGPPALTLETPAGQRLRLRDAPGTIEISDGSGNSVTISPSGVTVRAAAKVTVQAGIVDVSAGTLTVNAAISRFNGVVQADTVIANSLIGST